MKKGRIIQKIGVISRNSKNTKEINIVEWSEGYKVIDIRKWADEDAHKGISLNLKEAITLQMYLDEAINTMKSMMSGSVESMNLSELGLEPLSDNDLMK